MTWHNTTQHDTTRHDTTRHDTTRHDMRQHNTTRHDTTWHNTTQHDTTRHNTTQHNTTRHDMTQHNTTQHNTTRHNTTKYIFSDVKRHLHVSATKISHNQNVNKIKSKGNINSWNLQSEIPNLKVYSVCSEISNIPKHLKFWTFLRSTWTAHRGTS
jgi:hypothetical protein